MTIAVARQQLDAIELAMLESEAIEALRPARDAALAELREVEAAERERHEQLRRLPPSPAQLEALWRDYRELRILGRSRMSAAAKSRALRRFGRQLYEALPW